MFLFYDRMGGRIQDQRWLPSCRISTKAGKPVERLQIGNIKGIKLSFVHIAGGNRQG